VVENVRDIVLRIEREAAGDAVDNVTPVTV
jgi:hypothetical protein